MVFLALDYTCKYPDLDLGMPSKKKIAYNETLSYLGGRGSTKIPIICHSINGTFITGGRGSEFFVSCLILK